MGVTRDVRIVAADLRPGIRIAQGEWISEQKGHYLRKT